MKRYAVKHSMMQLLLLAALMVPLAQADPIDTLPGIQWENKYGDTSYSYQKDSAAVHPRHDSIIVFGSYKTIPTEKGVIPTTAGLWIWEINAQGEKIADIKIKNSTEKKYYKIRAFAVASDDNILLATELEDGTPELVKVKPNGEVLFSRKIDAGKIDTRKYISKILITEDGNVVLMGTQKKNVLLMKVDANGAQLSEKVINRGIDSLFMDGVLAADGGFVLIENTGKSPLSSLWLTKFDSTGVKLAEKSFPGKNGSIVRGKSDGYAIVYDVSMTSEQEIWFRTFDNDLNEKWNLNNASAKFGLERFKISRMLNGDYVVAGTVMLAPWISYVSADGLKKWDFHNMAMDPVSVIDIVTKDKDCFFISTAHFVTPEKKVVDKIRILNFRP